MDAALIILDGWGIGSHDRRNAVADAATPTVDQLMEGITGKLSASGRDVGLPDGQMGNSEVGHLNIGAGRVVTQPFTRIEDAIADGSFYANPVLTDAIESAARSEARVHFLGLVSPGGVHAHQRHLQALLELAADHAVPAVVHAFLDGRDTPPTSAMGYLEAVHTTMEETDTGEFGTISGRYYAMDRDENWERTYKAYQAIVSGKADYTTSSYRTAIDAAYDRDETDEFVTPTVIEDVPRLSDDDVALFFNFRPDRARQLVRMLTGIDSEWPFQTNPPDIELVTLTEYDNSYPFPVAFPPDEPETTLGTVLADHGLTQLRIAESEKYPHVTYFINGGREGAFSGEIREIIPSPDVPTYDHQPEMSATEVTDRTIEQIESANPDVMVLNYANPDMVGHTGDYDAAVAAVEAVDKELGRLLEVLDCHVLVIADHGNAEDMGTVDDPHTAHTTNPVPVFYRPPTTGSINPDTRIRSDGRLADVVPTLLTLLHIPIPNAMTGRSLLVE